MCVYIYIYTYINVYIYIYIYIYLHYIILLVTIYSTTCASVAEREKAGGSRRDRRAVLWEGSGVQDAY